MKIGLMTLLNIYMANLDLFEDLKQYVILLFEIWICNNLGWTFGHAKACSERVILIPHWEGKNAIVKIFRNDEGMNV